MRTLTASAVWSSLVVETVPWSAAGPGPKGGRRLVFEASPRDGSPAPDLESLRASLRAFARLRQHADSAAADSLEAPGVQDDAARPEVLPLDLTKTFVGPNGTYYDESWRLMEWRNANRSWNWAAALSLGGWLAYRRLYDYAVLHSVWLTLLILLALSGTPIKLLALAQVLVTALLGVYGNALYRHRFRQAAEAAARHDGEYAAQLAVLAGAGGTDRQAVWLMIVAMAGVSASLVAFRQAVDGVRLAL
jgi:hypothetical protein